MSLPISKITTIFTCKLRVFYSQGKNMVYPCSGKGLKHLKRKHFPLLFFELPYKNTFFLHKKTGFFIRIKTRDFLCIF